MAKCDLLKSETNNRSLAMLPMTSYVTLSTCVFILIGVLSFAVNGQILSVQASEVDSTYDASKDYTTFHFIQMQANTSSSNISTFKPQHDLIIIKSPSSSYIDKSGILHITGEVQNNFGFPVQSVQVTATLYGSQKNIIDRKSLYTYIDQLKADGGRSGFNIIVPANITKNSTGYSLSAIYTKSAPLLPKPAFLNLNINKGTKDLNGNYHLLGNVTNKGNNTTTHVKVSAVFFNGTNKIVDAEGGFTTPMNLQSGQTAPFNFTVLSPNLNEIKTVAVNTQSQEYSSIVNNGSGLVVPLPDTGTATPVKSSDNNNNSGKKTTDTDSEQRGKYKVDKGGKHYYDVHNCSNKKGSSGIGDLSECQQAEKETKEELKD